MNVTIGQYADFFEYWRDPKTGKETLKLGGKDAQPEEHREFLNQLFPSWITEELK